MNSNDMNRINSSHLKCICLVLFLAMGSSMAAQLPLGARPISADLFGLFFEDINYAADGGLYAELVQNRSFEYNPTERREWHPLSCWEYETTGYSYGRLSVETSQPVHPNNPHYLVLDVERIYEKNGTVGLKNAGFGGMVIQSGERYLFSISARRLSAQPVLLQLRLQNPQGTTLAETSLTISSGDWTRYSATLAATAASDSAQLVVAATTEGKLALDVVSLFPEHTFRNEPNGLRADLAQALADIHPRFIRFPGGCLAHGDGIGNMYRWKNTIGPIEERTEQRNIWGYHQTGGLGYYEYFRFCEDIGAKPLPVLPAAVSCQNSGGTWRIGGTGQRALPLEDMKAYVQEVLDLIEWANGPATSTWGAKRAAAGHPEPFHLEYIGIGNEDKITPEFSERFTMIATAIRQQHPEITIVGTAGPFPGGDDFVNGWKLARNLQIPVVDEHYYQQPEWFVSNQYRYDGYNRSQGQVYLGEYASWGNKLRNALAEALYMTSLERNGDVVRMASYAPLFAKKGFTQWKTDMIFFDNHSFYRTPNYYVQQLFATHAGDHYLDRIIGKDSRDSLVAGSSVMDSRSGDVILKLVNTGDKEEKINLDLSRLRRVQPEASRYELSGNADQENSFENPSALAPVQSVIELPGRKFSFTLPPRSLIILRIKTR